MEINLYFVRVFYKKLLKYFFSQSFLKKNKNTPYTIYGKLGVKS